MALRTWTSPHHTAWRRLLALLLVLSFAFATLSSHAVVDACQVDCAQFQGEILDTDESCSAACAAPVTSAQPAVIAPRALPPIAAIAVNDHTPQPPRRPPRA
ncbi:hypothetical protein [Halomonas nitroreducens]|uniref:DUF2946 domain-containing protein n=1 Tax=Halomonas nitroreducens TaxID=447425 RepID=A0A3S0QZH7_9GAMM|nr:hypothetical protein [Halomonas nitroreducens]RTQ99625.1 hypothetical protein EKG36_17310 [Halomonas nitroreducens]